MEVSSFELIYKPQAPVANADRVIQGYFLNITNLEDTELFFRVNFVTSAVSDDNRSLFNNTIAIIDTPNGDNQQASLVGTLSSSSFKLDPDVVVPAKGTAKVALLPSDPFPTMPGGSFPVPESQARADFEARGYVTLRLPPRLCGPQLAQPARVLLTPQNRATYVDSDGNINDQTQSTLPTASGAALAELQPEGTPQIAIPGIPGIPGVIFDELFDRLSVLRGRPMPDYSDIDVAMMLATLEGAGADLSKLNAELKKAGIGIAVEKRKG